MQTCSKQADDKKTNHNRGIHLDKHSDRLTSRQSVVIKFNKRNLLPQTSGADGVFHKLDRLLFS